MAGDPAMITSAELSKYHAAFKTHCPASTLMSGEKAKLVLLQSSLSREVLGKIWTLADHDRDGNLTNDEFAIAMHLVALCKGGKSLPSVLPAGLTPPLGAGEVSWVITDEMRTQYDSYFNGIDKDHDGFVSGEEVKPLFIASKVPQQTLAHIWTLCDTNGAGKLNSEQFALAMYLIAEKVRGKDPPTTIPPQMVPPSCRKTATTTTSAVATVTIGDRSGDYSAIKELDSLHGEVEQLSRQKVQLKQEVVEKQEAIQQKKTEIDSLESQLELCTREQQELDSQRHMVDQKLAQLDHQKTTVAMEIDQLRQKYQLECAAVQQLKDQVVQQEEAIKGQEQEMVKLNGQLKELQQEEQTLKTQVESRATELKKTQELVRSAQNNVAQTRQRVQELKEQHRSITASLALSQPPPHVETVAMPTDDNSTPLESDAVSHVATAGSSSPVSSISGFSETLQEDKETEKRSDVSHDPFNDNPMVSDPFTTDNINEGRDQIKDSFEAFGSDPFKQNNRHDNPFETDPFNNTPVDSFNQGGNNFSSTLDPFSSNDPFTTPPANMSAGFEDTFSSNWPKQQWGSDKNSAPFSTKS